ncbi:MAG: elongation factor-1 alpha [Methylohalobius sp. ZOD2]
MSYDLKNLPFSVKVLFTSYLIIIAMGYFIAMLQILFTHGLADSKFGLSIQDIVYSYYGNRSGSKLETMLNGSMEPYAPPEERFRIIQWVRDGASQAAYANNIRPIIQNRCVMCHNADSPQPDFTRFEEVKKRAATDTGATIQSLVRVSHIHLFGIAFIFMFVGIIFCFAAGVSEYLKGLAVAMPFIFQLTDIASWWLTKLSPHFAWLVIAGGAGMAMSFVFMWIFSLYEMWILPMQQKRAGIRTESYLNYLRPNKS